MTNDEIRDVIDRDGGVPILSDDEPETLLGVMPIPGSDDTRDEVRYPAWTERNAAGELPD